MRVIKSQHVPFYVNCYFKETFTCESKKSADGECERGVENLFCVKEIVVRYVPTGIGHHYSLSKPTSSQEKTLSERRNTREKDKKEERYKAKV